MRLKKTILIIVLAVMLFTCFLPTVRTIDDYEEDYYDIYYFTGETRGDQLSAVSSVDLMHRYGNVLKDSNISRSDDYYKEYKKAEALCGIGNVFLSGLLLLSVVAFAICLSSREDSLAGIVIGLIGVVFLTIIPLIILKYVKIVYDLAEYDGKPSLTAFGIINLILGIGGFAAALAVPGFSKRKVQRHPGMTQSAGTASPAAPYYGEMGQVRAVDRMPQQYPQGGYVPASQQYPQGGRVPASQQYPQGGYVPASQQYPQGGYAPDVAQQNGAAPANGAEAPFKICASCGAKVPVNSQFCTVCGAVQ